jgi:hypothetical protein
MEVVEEYLHNRHAKARNEFNAKRDPNMPDGGSGIHTADAQAYLDGLDPKQKRNLEAVAKLVDDIVNGTQEVLVYDRAGVPGDRRCLEEGSTELRSSSAGRD